MQQLVIAGGGAAGWMAAAMLARVYGHQLQITLVESTDIGIVGVGEATIPPIVQFNRTLGIDEAQFIRQTQGTFKLGIQFENWGLPGERYMHAFGEVGKPLSLCGFYHYWLRARQENPALAADLWQYSPARQAALAERFSANTNWSNSPFQPLAYAYHFDAAAYATVLQQHACAQGVVRIEGKITAVEQAVNGDISALVLDGGRQVRGDFFIDCTGFAALLLGKTLQTPYEDWSHWLLCDSALAVPAQLQQTPKPYTRAIAHAVGWQWQIPLQHRSGNGYVYSQAFISDDAAQQHLLSQLDGPALAEPRQLRFKTGRRTQQWRRNCLALGLASGFLEPLESTSLHLIQSGIMRLVRLMPGQGDPSALRDEYNRLSEHEFCQVRDFIIAHYHCTRRDDSEFWRYCRQMSIPDALAHRLALFRQSGSLVQESDALFTELAWQQVLLGQGVWPARYHPLADKLSGIQLNQYLQDLQTIVRQLVGDLPTHQAVLQQLSGAGR